MTNAAHRLTVAALGVAVCALAACSSPYGKPSSVAAPATTTTIPGSETPAQTKAADLRANVTYLLTEHAYLLWRVTSEVAGGAVPTAAAVPPAAEATTTTVASGGTGSGGTGSGGTGSGGTGAGSTTTGAAAPGGAASVTLQGAPDDAAAALDANSHDLADLLGAAYPAGFSDQFYALWSTRIAYFEDYAQSAAKDKTALPGITTALAGSGTALATLFHSVNKYLAVHTVTSPATGLADELSNDTTNFTAMIDAQAANDPTEYTKLVTAVEGAPLAIAGMPHLADVLASAAAKLDPDTYPGTPTGTAANLRATLTTALLEHVELTSLAEQAVAVGADAGPAMAALTGNSQQLHNVFSAIYGDAAAAQFDRLWGDQIGAYTAYAKDRAAGDTAGAAGQVPALTTFESQFANFLAGETAGRLSAGSLKPDLSAHVAAILNVIDGAGLRAPDEVTRVRLAASHVPGLASKVAEAVAEQFPTNYLP